MTRPIRTRTIVGTRPPQAPAGWLIYNAPRPIVASALPSGEYCTWQGGFCSGIFYVAVNPNDPKFAALHELNRKLDAVILTFVTEEELFQAGRTRLLANYPDAADVVDDPRQRWWVIENQLDHLNHLETA